MLEPINDEQPRVYLFDILAKNDLSLCHLPYAERRLLLNEIPNNNIFHLADTFELGKDNVINEIKKLQKKAMDKGVEGIVLKSKFSPYETSGNRGNSWLKLKNMSMADTLDLVPIGAYLGKGNRAGLFGSFLMASFNTNTK